MPQIVQVGGRLQGATASRPLHADSNQNLDHTAWIVVTTKDELQTAISNLSQGDSIWIDQPATPYRTDAWLDIDVSDVLIFAASRFAKDGDPIIKVSDAANVGGFRVGNGAAVSNVRIENVGYHGNDAGQTSGEQHHAFIFDQATDCELVNFFATRTHPYQQHNTGGSGVTCTANSTRIKIADGWIDDIGDRGVQLAGSGHRVLHNLIINGYDRSISLDMQNADTSQDVASDVLIQGNWCQDNSDGSTIAVSHGGAVRITILGNVLKGQYRGAVQADHVDCSDWLISGNFVHHTSADLTSNQELILLKGDHHHVSNNDILNEVINHTVWIGEGTGHVVEGNRIRTTANSGNPVLVAGGSQHLISGNYIQKIQSLDTHVIAINGADDTTILGNVIPIFGNGTTGRQGIFVQNCDRAVITGNIGLTSTRAEAFIKIASTATAALVSGNVNHTAEDTFVFDTMPDKVEGNYPEYFDLDSTSAIGSGGTLTKTVPNVTLTDRISVQATPANDPSNDFGVVVDKVWWDTSESAMKVQVSETESAGGGNVRITAKRVSA